jgi:two-component system, chemotaxis family, sensor histidine kinase and response regulator WspE
VKNLAPDPLIEVFRGELARHLTALRDCLARLESDANDSRALDDTERAAHALRGAALVVGLESIALLASRIEKQFLGARTGGTGAYPASIAALRKALALLDRLSTTPRIEPVNEEHERELEAALESLMELSEAGSALPSMPAAQSHSPSVRRSRRPPSRAAGRASASAPRLTPDPALIAVFRSEAETTTLTLGTGLVKLENGAADRADLEAMMRAAHSLKGAARIVGIDAGVELSHALEDCFVAVQSGRLTLDSGQIDLLLRGVDQLAELAKVPSETLDAFLSRHSAELRTFAHQIAALTKTDTDAPDVVVVAQAPGRADRSLKREQRAEAPEILEAERVVRVTGESIRRLMGLAGESLVEARRLASFGGLLRQLKQRFAGLGDAIEELERQVADRAGPGMGDRTAGLRTRAHECRELLSQGLGEFDAHARRMDELSDRLYREAQKTRMRPFADGTHALPRTVRDLGRELGKSVRLEIVGQATQVDREVLESLEAPLGHLLRNAVDHGIESREERRASGKPEQGLVRLEARHHAGMLCVRVSDDGKGIDPEAVRKKALERGLVTAGMAQSLSRAELMEFLFLPGFSTASKLTDISGRGVGLDVVRSIVAEIGGSVSASSEPGAGTVFNLELPVTRSVLRAILVEIAGEPYAFPLLKIARVVRMPAASIETMEGRQYFVQGDKNVGLVRAEQILRLDQPNTERDELSVVVIGDAERQFGVVVDRFLGEQDLVVRPLDPRLGKVQDIAAAAVLPDGTPALIVDVGDVLLSIGKLVDQGKLDTVVRHGASSAPRQRKRVLVVDDSITVREVERQLLSNRGYEVDVAVDGVDGWNSIQSTQYDLVITDVDMPRMNGIDLVRAVKQNARLQQIPVVIVSYKDRSEDRLNGLSAGANYYLTKSSFHDDTLVSAVEELIGAPSCE